MQGSFLKAFKWFGETLLAIFSGQAGLFLTSLSVFFFFLFLVLSILNLRIFLAHRKNSNQGSPERTEKQQALLRQNEALEREVQARTHLLEQKNRELEEQTRKLASLVQQHRLLQRKFAGPAGGLAAISQELGLVDQGFLEKLTTLVEAQYADPGFNVDRLCKGLNMSKTHLNRKMQALLGATPLDFIRKRRLEEAYRLLYARAGNVKEVAYQSGFNNLSYFAKCFKEQFGVRPSEVTKGDKQ